MKRGGHIAGGSRWALAAILLLMLAPKGWGHKLPHYVFILPDGYVGWIQIVFASPSAPEPIETHNGIILRVDDSGVLKVGMLHAYFTGSHDEFFYRKIDPLGKEVLVSVPVDYFCAEYSGLDNCFDPFSGKSDAFDVGRATVRRLSDGTPGNSWFLFVGPKVTREKLARPVHYYPGTKKQMDIPEDDPTPGRIRSEN
jgi:hypothetical protein